MPENSKENIKKQIKLYKFNDIPWIAELWALTEYITLDYSSELYKFLYNMDEFRLLTFYKSFQIFFNDRAKYLWHVYFSDEEMANIKGIKSLMRVRKTHVRIDETPKLIRNAIKSLLFSDIRIELKNVDLRYQIEFAKKEWMRESNEQVYPIQKKTNIAIQKKNASELKTFNNLHDIIEQLKNGVRSQKEVAENIGVSRMTIYRRLKEAQITFKQLISKVTSVT